MPNRLKEVRKELIAQEEEIDLEVLSTPTGDRRNALTEVHIHICAAIDGLRRIIEAK